VPAPCRAAVLGSPIAHSLSPVLHRAAYAALGLDGWTYTAIECDEAGLPRPAHVGDSASPGVDPPDPREAGAADFFIERAVDPRARPSTVLDVVYHPWATPLATAAIQSGVSVVSGFDLLAHQAAGQVELMTGLAPASLHPMRAAGRSELARAALPAR
jgi:shikimate 5-dehydrogenase